MDAAYPLPPHRQLVVPIPPKQLKRLQQLVVHRAKRLHRPRDKLRPPLPLLPPKLARPVLLLNQHWNKRVKRRLRGRKKVEVARHRLAQKLLRRLKPVCELVAVAGKPALTQIPRRPYLKHVRRHFADPVLRQRLGRAPLLLLKKPVSPSRKNTTRYNISLYLPAHMPERNGGTNLLFKQARRQRQATSLAPSGRLSLFID